MKVDTHGSVGYTAAAAAEYEAGPWSKDLAVNDLGSLQILMNAPPAHLDCLPGGLMSKLPKLASRIFRHVEGVDATKVCREHP